MTKGPACCTLEDNPFSVLDTFRSAGVVRRVPVVNEARELLGVVSLSDVAVNGKDTMDAILLDETHHALSEAHVMTGGKRVVKKLRRPTRDGPPASLEADPRHAARQAEGTSA